jgi:hypothetical protein
LLLTTFASACDACGPGVLGDLPATEGAGGSGSSGGSDESGPADTGALSEWTAVQLTVPKDVDVLMVIDDSSSMATRQGRIAANAAALVAVLEDAEVAANYRLGITTTDVGNPACAGGSPDRGAFVASSCHERLGDFVRDGNDVSQTGCLDYCGYPTVAPQPTTTTLDDVPTPRPWLESIAGNDNVGVTTTEAIGCWLPQGIAGCELVAPIEAAYLALERARTLGDPAYGFLRETAHLFVVFVTDGSDCSNSPIGDAIFVDPEPYWTDPDAAGPTSGACWNAGVACSGAAPGPDGSTTFEDCAAIDRGIDGEPSSPDNAVLWPVSRLGDRLDELRAERVWAGVGVEVVAIAGYPTSGAPLEYATSTESSEQIEHGIAPTCRDADGVGVGIPPVRLDDLVADDARQSICVDDYTPAFETIANTIRDQVRPACVTMCVADVDPSTVLTDVECEVQQTVPSPTGDLIVAVPECLADNAFPTADANVCWQALADRGGDSAETDDDMSDACIDEGWNLEVRLIRRDGHPAPGGTAVEIRCVPSEQPEIDCPGAG